MGVFTDLIPGDYKSASKLCRVDITVTKAYQNVLCWILSSWFSVCFSCLWDVKIKSYSSQRTQILTGCKFWAALCWKTHSYIQPTLNSFTASGLKCLSSFSRHRKRILVSTFQSSLLYWYLIIRRLLKRIFLSDRNRSRLFSWNFSFHPNHVIKRHIENNIFRNKLLVKFPLISAVDLLYPCTILAKTSLETHRACRA